MKDQLQGAVQGAKDAMLKALSTAQGSGEMTDGALLERYTTYHRGNPEAIIEFAREMAPRGNPVQQGLVYEKKMEALLRREQWS